MLIPSWIILLHAVSHDAQQLDGRTNSADICLPQKLQAAIPDCALSCLQTFILNNYYDLSCSATDSLANLCKSTTYSGLTIGEGSLQCVISTCLNVDIESQSGYNICEGVAGARPNMATTITATILPPLSSTASTTLSPTNTDTNLTSSSSITSTSTISSPSASTSSTLLLTNFTTAQSSSLTGDSIFPTSTSIVTAPSASSIGSSSLVTSTQSVTSKSATTSSATNSATAAAATEGAKKEQLGTGAIAGIATAAVVVSGLLIAYLAYLCFVKRREKQKRRAQRFSTWFLPTAGGPSGTTLTPIPGQSDLSAVQGDSDASYRVIIPSQEKRKSLWQRNQSPYKDVGMASGQTKRISQNIASVPDRSTSLSDAWIATAVRRISSGTNPAAESRWSVATSFDEDTEAQNQDIPILGSPRTRSSARSFSSTTMERPPPLRLSRIRPRADSPPTIKIPLTPVYDNGTFEPTIRQVVYEPGVVGANVRESNVQHAPNFSRREPSLGRTSHDDNRPFWSQNRQPNERFPVKSSTYARKQSQTSNQSISVYTDIEEDDTPENEENKQLQLTYAYPVTAGRSPLKDLRYPQIPRSASLAKQAEKPHSPRAVTTMRTVEPVFETNAPSKPSLYHPHTSSSSDMQSASSASPVFPTPPRRAQLRAPSQAQSDLTRQISNAYKSASRPTTATTPSTVSNSLSRYPPVPQQPGTMYQQIQRLSTGRPLAQKLQNQGYMPRHNISRANFTPMPGRNGDMYFRLS